MGFFADCFRRNGGLLVVSLLFVVFFVGVSAWTSYEAKDDVRVYSEHGITFASFDADGSRYANYGNFEEIAYDGGFVGFITFGAAGVDGRFQVVNRRYYRLVDGRGMEISVLPPKIMDVLQRGRKATRFGQPLARDVSLTP